MTTDTIEIVDHGRGPQLSTSRITIQDLVPYFQEGCSHDEILGWIPALTSEEIVVAERYYREHQVELDEEDQKIRDFVAEQIKLQRLRFPEEPPGARLARMKETYDSAGRSETVKGILADNDVRGQVEYLVRLMQAEPWREFWQDLGLDLIHFEDLGLSGAATDAEVWERSQAAEVVLVTGNRNLSGPDSLEATIRGHNTPQSLPVLTIADVRKLNRSKAYAEEVVESLIDYLQRIETVRGAGRLYLP